MPRTRTAPPASSRSAGSASRITAAIASRRPRRLAQARSTADTVIGAKRLEYEPDETCQSWPVVSIPASTRTASSGRPSSSATTWAATVSWPWPSGAVAIRRRTPPIGSIVSVADSVQPDLPRPRARSSGVWARAM